MKELEPAVKITLSALFGTLADHITTKIGLGYPELVETNPMFNFFNEFAFGSAGGIAIYGLGRVLRQPEDVSLVFGLLPSAMSYGVALNNIVWIIYAHRNYYPWKECPILYPEGEE